MDRLISREHIYLIFLLLGAMLSLRSFLRHWPRPFKVFSIFLWVTLATEALAIGWTFWLHDTRFWHYNDYNLWIYNAYELVRQLFFLALFYGIIRNGRVRRAIKLIVIPLILFAAIDYFYIQGPNQVDNYLVLVANLITVLLCLAFFLQLLNEERLIRLWSASEFWIVTGAFFYYAGSLPFFMSFGGWIAQESPLASAFLFVNDVLNIFMYICCSIAFLCMPYSLKRIH